MKLTKNLLFWSSDKCRRSDPHEISTVWLRKDSSPYDVSSELIDNTPCTLLEVRGLALNVLHAHTYVPCTCTCTCTCTYRQSNLRLPVCYVLCACAHKYCMQSLQGSAKHLLSSPTQIRRSDNGREKNNEKQRGPHFLQILLRVKTLRVYFEHRFD